MPASITLSGLSYSTPDGRLLFDKLNIAFGVERTGLVGRNGVGKSTLLRLVAAELSPRSGTVSVGGRVAVLRQIVAPPPGVTVADLFGVTDGLALIDRAEAGRAHLAELTEADWTLPSRLEASLSRLCLGIRPDTPLAALSGGQRTRAALAGAMFGEPEVLLLDEPTRGVDVGARYDIHALLRELTAEGKAVVLASSDLPELVYMADRILVFRDGKVATTVSTEGLDQAGLAALCFGTPTAPSA